MKLNRRRSSLACRKQVRTAERHSRLVSSYTYVVLPVYLTVESKREAVACAAGSTGYLHAAIVAKGRVIGYGSRRDAIWLLLFLLAERR